MNAETEEMSYDANEYIIKAMKSSKIDHIYYRYDRSSILSFELLPNKLYYIKRSDGLKYIGTWLEVHPSDNEVTEIDTHQKTLSGKGTMFFPDGYYLDGEFYLNNPHGKCVCKDPNDIVLKNGYWFSGYFIGERYLDCFDKINSSNPSHDIYFGEGCLYVCGTLNFVLCNPGEPKHYSGETKSDKKILSDKKQMCEMPHGKGLMIYTGYDNRNIKFNGDFLDGKPTTGKITLGNGFECSVFFESGFFYPL